MGVEYKGLLNRNEVETLALNWGDVLFLPENDPRISEICRQIELGYGGNIEDPWSLFTHYTEHSDRQAGIERLGGVIGGPLWTESTINYGQYAANDILKSFGYPCAGQCIPGKGYMNVYIAPLPSEWHSMTENAKLMYEQGTRIFPELEMHMMHPWIAPWASAQELRIALGDDNPLLQSMRLEVDADVQNFRIMPNYWRIAVLDLNESR